MTRWYEREEAATLLAAIRIEQPEYVSVRAHAWTEQRRPHFKGMNARRLRQLFEAELEAAMDVGCHAEVARLRNHEAPDAIIERVLNEQTVPWTPMRFDTDPETGNARFAA